MRTRVLMGIWRRTCLLPRRRCWLRWARPGLRRRCGRVGDELPSTHGALVEDRSGLAVRGITTLAGVIDPGYRGELKIVLTNLTSEPQMVAPGHRIAQLRIVERIQATFEETDMLAEAPRGVAGFGSTRRVEQDWCGNCRGIPRNSTRHRFTKLQYLCGTAVMAITYH